MTEDRLQHELFMWFSQTYPHLEGDMFMIQNTTYSVAHGSRMKAMGLKKNVSDICLVLDKKCLFLELKAKGSTHNREHIQGQLTWGRRRHDQGHYFVITEKLNLLKAFIDSLILGYENIAEKMEQEFYEDIVVLLSENKKTIKF